MKKRKYIISACFILIGISILLYPKISNYVSKKNQIEIIKQYDEKIEKIDKEELKLEHEKAKKYNEKINKKNQFVQDNEYNNILNINNNGIMSYIEIPKIEAVLPIYHGTTEQVLKNGVGHLSKSSFPIGGENTHCVLTGHTGLLRAEIFTRLNELEIDDYFYINTLEEKLTYKIYKTKIILPDETDELKILEGKDLVTLVTCTPYGINTHRLLVQGERIQTNENTEKKYIVKESKNEKKQYICIVLILILILIIIILLIFILLYSKIHGKERDF